MGKRNDEAWVASDGHERAVALGVQTVSESNCCRDAVAPEVTRAGAAPPAFRRVAAGTRFVVNDQWCRVVALDGFWVAGVTLQRVSDSALFLAGKPFFASGTQEFISPADILVWLAPREEMLSDFNSPSFPSNGSQFSESLSGFTFGPFALLATEWAYVFQAADGTLGVRVQPAGTIQAGDRLPFGWNAPDANLRGRYYNVEFNTQGTGGNQSVEIAHELGGGLYGGPAISLQRTAPNGHCQVGDDVSLNIAGPTFVVSNYSQQQVLGSKSWTLVIRPAAALTGVTGRFDVIRRGF